MTHDYSNDKLEEYGSTLARVASLSKLFSESKTPYLNYRTTEYLYARTLDAHNLARSDIAIDAKRGDTGIGIKTFIYHNRPKYEKIAEFNKHYDSFKTLGSLEKLKKVAELRNERIDFAGRTASVSQFIYHCIARVPGKLIVFEVPMPKVDIDSIAITNEKGGSISFSDGTHKYRFSSSKSTLYMEFYGDSFILEKPVVIYDDPFTALNTIDINERPAVLMPATVEVTDEKEHVILPLYGYDKNKEPFVYEKSGLNQWNGGGRVRSLDEVYIPIPADVHKKMPGFLPPRDQHFELYFPDESTLTVKVCQGGGKALMSKHNSELGEKILRDKLGLDEGEILTYEKLEKLGVDSVEISKLNNKYYLDFKRLGSYEKFLEP